MVLPIARDFDRHYEDYFIGGFYPTSECSEHRVEEWGGGGWGEG